MDTKQIMNRALNNTTTDPNAWMDEPIKSDKWINVHFTKDGKSHEGVMIHDSEEAALKRHNELLHRRNLGLNAGIIRKSGGNTAWSDYSHCIQLPIKE